MSESEKNLWQVKERRTAYENPWIRVDHHEVVDPGGRDGVYGVVHFKNYAIGMLPIHADGTVTLVGQYRFPLKCYSWEVPAGGGRRDTAPIETAQRELQEETGIVAREWREVLRMELSNSVTDELAICFLALDLEEGPATPDADEKLEVRRFAFREALDLAVGGEFPDSLTVALLMRAQLMALDGVLPRDLAAAMLGKR